MKLSELLADFVFDRRFAGVGFRFPIFFLVVRFGFWLGADDGLRYDFVQLQSETRIQVGNQAASADHGEHQSKNRLRRDHFHLRHR